MTRHTHSRKVGFSTELDLGRARVRANTVFCATITNHDCDQQMSLFELSLTRESGWAHVRCVRAQMWVVGGRERVRASCTQIGAGEGRTFVGTV